MLCYVMLCYVMLCYVMLCYVMLCYPMFLLQIGHYCQRLNPCEVEHLCIDVCYEPGYKCTHCKELPSGMPCQRCTSLSILYCFSL